MTELRGPLPFKVREGDMFPQLDGIGITVRVDVLEIDNDSALVRSQDSGVWASPMRPRWVPLSAVLDADLKPVRLED